MWTSTMLCKMDAIVVGLAKANSQDSVVRRCAWAGRDGTTIVLLPDVVGGGDGNGDWLSA